MERTYDVVIVGGGVIGCAIAHFLTAHPGFGGSVAVVERDPTYATASSALSASSIRQQFSTAENIALSRFGVDFLRDAGRHLSVDGAPVDLGLRENGYLYLATADGAGTLRANHAVQRAAGADIALLPPDDLAARFPWLAVDDVALGALGLSGEGWFDGYALLQAFRRKARAAGAVFLTGAVETLGREGARVTAAVLADGTRLPCGTLVNAAGPHARAVAAMAGVALPVSARKRCVFVFSCREALPACPLVIDPSGVWFRPEGTRFIAGAPPPGDDPDTLDLTVDHGLFDEVLWPALARRVPSFEAVKVAGAWAGHYDYNDIDQNAILGRHPEITNLLFANGFSGHGLQQAPGVGRGIAELVAGGGWGAIDLSIFAYDRLAAGRLVTERCVI